MPQDLSPCPFCGKAHTLKLTSAEELAREGDDFDDAIWPHSDSWAVMCDASRPDGPGGCGASGGFFPTEAEAVQAWNRRTALEAQAAEIARLRALHGETFRLMQDEIASNVALTRERDGLRVDAERYRFIRDADRSDCITPELALYAMESLDEYVDAAMEDEAALIAAREST